MKVKNNDNFIGNIDEKIKTFKHSLYSDEIKLSDVIKTEEQLNLFLDCDKLFKDIARQYSIFDNTVFSCTI